jgi:hypothetical protein
MGEDKVGGEEGQGDDDEGSDSGEEEADDDVLASAEDYLDGTAADGDIALGTSHLKGNSNTRAAATAAATTATTAALQCSCTEGTTTKFFSKSDGPQYLFGPTTCPAWEFSLSVVAVHRPAVAGVEPAVWTDLSRALRGVHEASGKMWCVLMLSSGRFAGAVFDGPTANVVVHRSFRRYTVRAKAGGSQSSHDNQGRKAKSAGAMLRRYGEQALREDVRAVLHEWSALLQSCSAVFLSCPRTMRGVLFDEGTSGEVSHRQATIRKDDPRVRLVPFMVNKPTFEEVKAIHSRISTVTFQARGVYEASTTATATATAAASSSGSGTVAAEPALPKRESKPVLPPPQLRTCPALLALHAACAAGDLTAVEAIVAAHGDHPPALAASTSTPESPPHDPTLDPSSQSQSQSQSQSHPQSTADDTHPWDLSELLNTPTSLDDLSTPLHTASENDQEDLVYYLLSQGADPTRVDARNRPPYFLAKSKNVRDAFRRARGREGAEERWAWDAAGVPAALTDEAEQLAKEKDKAKKLRAKQNKKEKKERDEVEAAEAVKRAEERKLAAVEEAKQRQVDAGVCGQCGRSLFGVKALDVFDRRCCSSPCVMLLRRRLAAEAAEKRFSGAGAGSK